MLLLRQALEKTSYVNLNGDYDLELGEVIDIINQNYSEQQILLSLIDEDAEGKNVVCLFDIEDKAEELTLSCSLPIKGQNNELGVKNFITFQQNVLDQEFHSLYLRWNSCL